MSERPPDASAEAPDPASDERDPKAIAAASDPQGSLTALQVMASTVAAAFGVQSSRNRQRDFTHGKAWHFILAGIVFTVVFVVGMVWVVGLVLDSAT